MLILSFNLSKKFIGFGASFVKKTIAMGRRSKKRHANLLDFCMGRIKVILIKRYMRLFSTSIICLQKLRIQFGPYKVMASRFPIPRGRLRIAWEERKC